MTETFKFFQTGLVKFLTGIPFVNKLQVHIVQLILHTVHLLSATYDIHSNKVFISDSVQHTTLFGFQCEEVSWNPIECISESPSEQHTFFHQRSSVLFRWTASCLFSLDVITSDTTRTWQMRQKVCMGGEKRQICPLEAKHIAALILLVQRKV